MLNSRYLGNTELGVAVGPVDDGLGSNVSSRVRVGGCGVSALPTAKRVAFCPIGFLAVPTFGARSACVSRVYRDHADPSSSRLVGHELSELVERPIRQSGTLRLFGLNPIPNALQGFDGNVGIGAFSVSDQALGNLVVYILLISSLTPLKRTELSFCGTSPFALQIAAAVSIDAALSFYCFGGVTESLTVTGGSGASHLIGVKMIYKKISHDTVEELFDGRGKAFPSTRTVFGLAEIEELRQTVARYPGCAGEERLRSIERCLELPVGGKVKT